MSLRSFTCFAMLAVAPAYAATTIDETRPLNADGRVHIENLKGRVVVRTWAQPQVHITGSLGKGVEKLEIGGDARSLDIGVKYPNSNGGWNLWGRDDHRTEPSIIEVTLPQRASVEIETVSADIDVQQMAGRKLDASSVSGSILVTASSPGEASFENVSGNTTLRITTGKVHVESVSGNVSLQGGLNGEVGMESVSGDVKLTAQALDRLDVNTVSGDLLLQVALKPTGTIKAETLSGSLELIMPKSTGAKLHAESFSGDIRSPSGKVDEEEHGPGKTLDTTYGNGQAQINLESFSGNVSVQLN
jgi:hypothetical protein